MEKLGPVEQIYQDTKTKETFTVRVGDTFSVIRCALDGKVYSSDWMVKKFLGYDIVTSMIMNMSTDQVLCEAVKEGGLVDPYGEVEIIQAGQLKEFYGDSVVWLVNDQKKRSVNSNPRG